MWSPATHALSTTLPVALALAEARGAPGREVLTALVKGIEIQGWLREASGQFTPDVLQFHPPGLVGPMGAVAAAGHLLGLDAGRLANAFGIADKFLLRDQPVNCRGDQGVVADIGQQGKDFLPVVYGHQRVLRVESAE